MGQIRPLAPAVAALVAAEEVIQRPASVAKELLDNALDAGARSIDVQITEGGVRLLRVADDGMGMDAADAALAFVRHATSKLVRAADLETLATAGFRGEGLASIAAVAEVTLTTAQADTDVGSRVEARYGSVGPVTFAVSRPGTVIEVRHLFAQTPARRRFLESTGREAGRLLKVVRDAAVARPDVAFTVTGDGEPLLRCTPTDLAGRIAQIYGEAFSDTLMPVAHCADGLEVLGYVSMPDHLARQSRRSHWFVNRRPIVSPELRRVVSQAFHGRAPQGYYPEAILFVALEARHTDVNLSPDKSLVRFAEPGRVYAAAQAAVRAALADPYRTAGVIHSALEADAVAMPPARSGSAAEETASPLTFNEAPGLFADPRFAPERPFAGASSAAVSLGAGAPGAAVLLPEHPPALWQLANTFIVAPVREGLLVLDQHSVAEAIAYHALAQHTPDAAAQGLLFPVAIPCPDADARLTLQALHPVLAEAGFDLEPSGPGGDWWLHAVPAVLADRDPARVLATAMTDLADPVRRAGGDAARVVRERLLKTIACHSAIRAGQPLSEDAMRALWGQARTIDLTLADVHGRAAALLVTPDELARRLQRGSLPGVR